jgi:hypothetical protein
MPDEETSTNEAKYAQLINVLEQNSADLLTLARSIQNEVNEPSDSVNVCVYLAVFLTFIHSGYKSTRCAEHRSTPLQHERDMCGTKYDTRTIHSTSPSRVAFHTHSHCRCFLYFANVFTLV